MTKKQQSDMLIKMLQIWHFVRYCDRMIEAGDEHATKIVSRYYADRSIGVDEARLRGVLPMAQLDTTIAMLHTTLFFASTKEKSRWQAWMKGPQAYDIRCSGMKCPRNPNIFQVICTIRNALAHEFDDDNRISVSFPAGEEAVVSFDTTRGVVSAVKFLTRRGLGDFLADLTEAVRRMSLEDAAEGAAR